MVKEELNSPAGFIALLAVLAILVILLAVLALVVVKALAESPWGVFTVGATIPIALTMGCYMRFVRIGKVLEASAFGITLLLLAVWGGKLVYQSPTWSQFFSLHGITLAWTIIGYGVISSSLPVWLLLAPRDYLSTFMKLGTIVALAFGILLVLPALQLPALTRFTDGSGLVVAGKVFPFCFITIACGAVSGFHALIASGTTPKMITRENYARHIGYGAMCCESFVAIMALIAACALDPGVYFSMNVKGEPAATVAQVTALGFPVTTDQMHSLANQLGEKTLFGRTGGAATLAVGMAHIFSKAVNGRGLDLWYHFAIMFEALFILTTVDAGTRVGRYLIQSVLGRVWKPLGESEKLFRHAGGRHADGRRVGLFSDSRRARPAGRHQLALAAVRHCQPDARRHRAVPRHDDYFENAIETGSRRRSQRARESRAETAGTRADYFDSAGLAGGGDVHGGRAENLASGSAHRVFGTGGNRCVKRSRLAKEQFERRTTLSR